MKQNYCQKRENSKKYLVYTFNEIQEANASLKREQSEIRKGYFWKENVITKFKNPLETMNTKLDNSDNNQEIRRQPSAIFLAVEPDIYYIDWS